MISRRDMQADANATELRQMGVVTNVPVSSAEIDAAMMAVIRACLAEGRPIDVAAFRLALVPENQIAPRFKRLMAAVRAEPRRRR